MPSIRPNSHTLFQFSNACKNGMNVIWFRSVVLQVFLLAIFNFVTIEKNNSQKEPYGRNTKKRYNTQSMLHFKKKTPQTQKMPPKCYKPNPFLCRLQHNICPIHFWPKKPHKKCQRKHYEKRRKTLCEHVADIFPISQQIFIKSACITVLYKR